MNGHGSALQHVCIAGAVVGVLWGMGAAGMPLAQGGSVRPPSPRIGALLRSTSAHAAIVDGQSASITEFPFQVALYDPRLGSPAKGFFCGGVIIDATRVATAAHSV
jgi:hypothetical protein